MRYEVYSLKKVKLKIIGKSQTGFQKKISNQKQSFKKTSFKPSKYEYLVGLNSAIYQFLFGNRFLFLLFQN